MEVIVDLGNGQGIRCLRNGQVHRAICRLKRIAEVAKKAMDHADSRGYESHDACEALNELRIVVKGKQ